MIIYAWIKKVLLLAKRGVIADRSNDSKEVFKTNGWGVVYSGGANSQ